MPVVCFVTCLAWPNISESDGHVGRALEARGVAVSAVAWNQPEARFWNPPALIRWTLTKRYLLDLERAGVPVIPTVVPPLRLRVQ